MSGKIAGCAIVVSPVGTEEMAHMEMLQTMLRQSLKNARKDDLIKYDMLGWVTAYGETSYYANWGGTPWTAAFAPTTGDPIADLTHDMGAEQRARAGYDAALKYCDDPDYANALQFLREREIVHYQRFGEALENVYEKKDKKMLY